VIVLLLGALLGIKLHCESTAVRCTVRHQALAGNTGNVLLLGALLGIKFWLRCEGTGVRHQVLVG
jgi:hypothetical protein